MGDERDFTETEILVGAVQVEISGKKTPLKEVQFDRSDHHQLFVAQFSSLVDFHFCGGYAERIENCKSHSFQLPAFNWKFSFFLRQLVSLINHITV